MSDFMDWKENLQSFKDVFFLGDGPEASSRSGKHDTEQRHEGVGEGGRPYVQRFLREVFCVRFFCIR